TPLSVGPTMVTSPPMPSADGPAVVSPTMPRAIVTGPLAVRAELKSMVWGPVWLLAKLIASRRLIPVPRLGLMLPSSSSLAVVTGIAEGTVRSWSASRVKRRRPPRRGFRRVGWRCTNFDNHAFNAMLTSDGRGRVPFDGDVFAQGRSFRPG